MTSPLAASVAADVLYAGEFLESAILIQETEGLRDEYGEWRKGAAIETDVQVATAPGVISRGIGQQRYELEGGLRSEEKRTFWWPGDIVALRVGETDGDVLVLGGLGTSPNRFTGTSRDDAEQLRDQYSQGNDMWLSGYRSDRGKLIQLRGYGAPVWQLYDHVEGHWSDAPGYRVDEAARWGSFTEAFTTSVTMGD